MWEPLPAVHPALGLLPWMVSENTPIDATAAAFAAATAVAAADVVVSLSSERRAGAISRIVLSNRRHLYRRCRWRWCRLARLLRRSHSSSSSGFGNWGRRRSSRLDYRRGRAWPYRSRRRFQNLGPDFGDRLSRYALVRIGPIKARSKRPGSTSFGSFLGSGRRKTSIRGCTGSIGRGVAGGLTGGGSRERTGDGAKVTGGGIEGSTTAPIGTRAGSAVCIPATARLTRQARNAPMKYEASSNRNVCRSR